jgi:hypothetical protein
MEVKFNPAKHLYGRGWLGFIPLVGGFVGIGLILLGIFKYRDRKLILIGLFALSFTIIIYSSLFYYTEYSKTGRENIAKISQDALNDLVINIEFYKQKHGSYPDSLEQIEAMNKFAWILDPLQSSGPRKKKTKFNYRKFGDKYLLFSSGIDGIPNTKDDIYPIIHLNDSLNTNLSQH